MTGKPVHSMIRVDEARATEFYRRAFGLEPADRIAFDDFTLIYLRNATSPFELELTVNNGRVDPYVLGDGYGHFAVVVDDLDGEHARPSGGSQARAAARIRGGATALASRASSLSRIRTATVSRSSNAADVLAEADPRLSQPEHNADQGGRYERNRSSQQNRSSQFPQNRLLGAAGGGGCGNRRPLRSTAPGPITPKR